MTYQVNEDIKNGVENTVKIPSNETDRDQIIALYVHNVKNMMDSNRKVTSLKTLQGRMWKKAYENGSIKGQ